jgi:hypothetical protein
LVRISTQVVSPPYFTTSFPETGMEPLDPQILINIFLSSPLDLYKHLC